MTAVATSAEQPEAPTLGPVPLTPTRTAIDQPRPGLRWRHAVIRLLLFIAVFAAVSAILAVIGGALGAKGDAALYVFGAAQLVASIVAYAALCAFEKRHPVELATHRAGGALAGLALGTVGMLVIFGLVVALGGRTIERTGGHIDWPIVFAAGLVAGISEEIIFRGVLYRLLESGLGTWGATAISGLVFGLVHLTNPHATMTGAIAIALEAGVLFGLLYAWTRNLWLLMGFHAAWNIVQGPVLGSAISGATKDGSGWVVSHAAGSDLLSGGVFGLEASIVTVLVWSILSVWLALQIHRRRLAVAPWWLRRRAISPSSSQEPAM